jgi:hypothetical protein
LPIIYAKEVSHAHFLKSGNIKIANKSAIINVESFQDPVIKSYMFGERKTMPERLLSSTAKSSTTTSDRAKHKNLPPPPSSMF